MTTPHSAQRPRSFPDGFLWGAATAGHQVEGSNVNADIWHEEWAPGSAYAEPSGDAIDHYHRYREDIALLADAGLSAFRTSVEWSRVEPEPGYTSRAALDHYRRVFEACHERGVEPVLTFNHFTVPAWFAAQGAWTSRDAPERFAAYCQRVAQHLGDLVTYAFTLNEPNVASLMSAIGMLPFGTDGPDRDSDLWGVVRPKGAPRVGADPDKWRTGQITWPEYNDQVIQAHRLARDAAKSSQSHLQVGWTLALADLQPTEDGVDAWREAQFASEELWLEVSRDDDIVGVQSYGRERIGPHGRVPVEPGRPTNQLGWELYAPALANTCRLAAEVSRRPVLVTENGVATLDDGLRTAHTRATLEELHAAIQDGVDIRGYLHWTLLDNFEWASGYEPRFGLIEVDRTTFERRPKPSLAWLGTVARANALDVASEV